MDEELKKLIENTAAETRRHFDVVAERLERKSDTLAETVIAIDEKVERRFAALEESIARTAAETQAIDDQVLTRGVRPSYTRTRGEPAARDVAELCKLGRPALATVPGPRLKTSATLGCLTAAPQHRGTHYTFV